MQTKLFYYIFYLYVYICVFLYSGAYTVWNSCGGQSITLGSQFFPTMCVRETKLRLSGLAAITFLYLLIHLHSCQCIFKTGRLLLSFLFLIKILKENHSFFCYNDSLWLPHPPKKNKPKRVGRIDASHSCSY